MQNLTRRSFLQLGTSTLLGLTVGCGGTTTSTLPLSLAGRLVLNQSQDGSQNASTRVLAVRPDGSEAQILLDNHWLSSVSPDGQVLAVAPRESSGGTGALRLYFTEGRAIMRLSVPGSARTAWSPDSQQLLSNLDEPGKLALISRASGSQRTVVERTGGLEHFGWLGTDTIFFTTPEGTFRQTLASGTATLLSTALYASASPSGRYLLRQVYELQGYELLDLETKRVYTATENPKTLTLPSWSSQNTLRALAPAETGYLALQVTPEGIVTAQLPLPLAASERRENPPVVSVWSPEGSSVGYETSLVDFQYLDIHHAGRRILQLTQARLVAWL